MEATSAVVLVLPAVPVTPTVAPRQRSRRTSPRRGDARALRAQAVHARRRLRRPDVEVRDVCRPRDAIEVGVWLDGDAERAKVIRRRRRRRLARNPDGDALAREVAGEGDRIGIEALDESYRGPPAAGSRAGGGVASCYRV